VLREEEDAFGQLLAEFVRGGRPTEVVERDDGAVFTGGVAYWFAPFGRGVDHEAGYVAVLARARR
jgi:hypothetical protein